MSRNSTFAVILATSVIIIACLTGCGGDSDTTTDIIAADNVAANSATTPGADIHIASMEEITGHQKLIARDLHLKEAPAYEVAEEKDGVPIAPTFKLRYWNKTQWLNLTAYAGRRFIGPCGSYGVSLLPGIQTAGKGGVRVVVLKNGQPIAQQSPGVWGFGYPALYTWRVSAVGMTTQVFTLEVVSAPSVYKVMRAVAIDLSTGNEYQPKAGSNEPEVGQKFVVLPAFYNALTGKRVSAPAGQISQIWGGTIPNNPIASIGGSSFQAINLGTCTTTLCSTNYSNTRSWFSAEVRIKVVVPKILFRNVPGWKARITQTDTQIDLARSSAGYMVGNSSKKYIFNLDATAQSLGKGGYGGETYARADNLISGNVCGYLLGVDELSSPNGGWYRITWELNQSNQAECPMETLWVPTPLG